MKGLYKMINDFKKKFVDEINGNSQEYKLNKSEFGHYYVLPMPSNYELSEFYKDKYFNNEVKVDSKGMDIGSKDIKERFHYDRQYLEITTFLENNFTNKNIKILDVGCGTGKLLEYLYDVGYKNLKGTEYDSNLNNENINIFNGSFLDFNSNEKFDFISFNNVLEHVINPLKFIKKAKNLLTDNGFIRIQVPNDLTYPQFKALKDKVNPNFYFFCPPEHLHYFDFESLENMLNSCDFKVVKKMTSWAMDIFILMGLDYSSEASLGKVCHNYRLNLEYNLGEEFLLKYYSKMAEIGLGRVVIEYAKKT